MTLGDLPRTEIRRRLKRERLCLRTGPFVVAVRTPLARLADAIATLYTDFPLIDDCAFADFDIEIAPRRGLRRWLPPQAVFTLGGWFRHDAFRRSLAPAFFEWGLNCCVSRSVLHYLVLHGAVVERGGRALVLLGASGAGKSTLCAALIVDGWRLLSDELTLIRPGSRGVVGLARPISLKNEAIDLVRTLAPRAVMGPTTVTPRKGRMAHLRPPRESVQRMDEPATLSRFVFVRYEPGAAPSLQRVAPADALARIARQSFNYGVRGRRGFEHLARLVDECPSATLTYGDVRDAVRALDDDDVPDRL